MGRHAQLMANIKVGEDLIAKEHFGASQIQSRIDKVKESWARLEELCKQRKDRLHEAQDMYQVRRPAAGRAGKPRPGSGVGQRRAGARRAQRVALRASTTLT